MSTLPLSLGAVEVAILVSSAMYGVTTLQAWLYAERFSNDQLYIRVAVRIALPQFYRLFTHILVVL